MKTECLSFAFSKDKTTDFIFNVFHHVTIFNPSPTFFAQYPLLLLRTAIFTTFQTELYPSCFMHKLQEEERKQEKTEKKKQGEKKHKYLVQTPLMVTHSHRLPTDIRNACISRTAQRQTGDVLSQQEGGYLR